MATRPELSHDLQLLAAALEPLVPSDDSLQQALIEIEKKNISEINALTGHLKHLTATQLELLKCIVKCNQERWRIDLKKAMKTIREKLSPTSQLDFSYVYIMGEDSEKPLYGDLVDILKSKERAFTQKDIIVLSNLSEEFYIQLQNLMMNNFDPEHLFQCIQRKIPENTGERKQELDNLTDDKPQLTPQKSRVASAFANLTPSRALSSQNSSQSGSDAGQAVKQVTFELPAGRGAAAPVAPDSYLSRSRSNSLAVTPRARRLFPEPAPETKTRAESVVTENNTEATSKTAFTASHQAFDKLMQELSEHVRDTVAPMIKSLKKSDPSSDSKENSEMSKIAENWQVFENAEDQISSLEDCESALTSAINDVQSTAEQIELAKAKVMTYGMNLHNRVQAVLTVPALTNADPNRAKPEKNIFNNTEENTTDERFTPGIHAVLESHQEGSEAFKSKIEEANRLWMNSYHKQIQEVQTHLLPVISALGTSSKDEFLKLDWQKLISTLETDYVILNDMQSALFKNKETLNKFLHRLQSLRMISIGISNIAKKHLGIPLTITPELVQHQVGFSAAAPRAERRNSRMKPDPADLFNNEPKDYTNMALQPVVPMRPYKRPPHLALASPAVMAFSAGAQQVASNAGSESGGSVPHPKHATLSSTGTAGSVSSTGTARSLDSTAGLPYVVDPDDSDKETDPASPKTPAKAPAKKPNKS